MKIFKGNLIAQGLKFGIIVSRFNELVTSKLLDGAIDCLKRHGTNDEDIEIFYSPGSFEIPLIAKKLAQTGKYNAVICLGAIIRGETPHFDYIASEVSKGIAQVQLETGIPIAFGIITTDDVEQALNRSGMKNGNKGWDAALTAIEMANLINQIKK
ncbi:6,7-dimethyl-8-ribityllumazine synthase [Candidatus Kryptonium thompsonii]|jgi:6,7-dimethyl-8-ribityllumazine synthase|uniref:6,7-dimethyl-8-ribityllumazine synthase n=1 Tax=Candidatus Kryptonium thompsonii TaxID=1633631 RepID=A0A0P1LG07_9BACT|nr:6,7-dimethyl-8-ribityllumazine synthase [Candidatus Kryptonium thompsoni]CUS80477.1 6,7-dimethyl-8-ribityllumazine synthase [Candidatus Kryptonium thompsoni]CUS82471.1 6,7-dimethyl-8-ribityllumazine synthase [Candidatus Kryptonium thompsoni]CUS82624.1 6,7-dimethyl-8-ribityllumazine synthase [Candidatus Kryptonium thompsoni]CUS83944.1 6,7-dimethyl-8-ribityllumazine synthase [Candidatus Kryptonium thompsoni]CUS88395.1 6,7-dimethyl-8-ribityllumazine synthase [Candidatus Kryptonium thompsoni]